MSPHIVDICLKRKEDNKENLSRMNLFSFLMVGFQDNLSCLLVINMSKWSLIFIMIVIMLLGLAISMPNNPIFYSEDSAFQQIGRLIQFKVKSTMTQVNSIL